MPQRRVTKQRQVIESVLRLSQRPLLPNELLMLAQEKLPSLGIATVFRAVKDLIDEGIVNPVNIVDEATRYEFTRDHHHHFKCSDCGIVYDIHSCPGNLEKLLPPGFQLIAHDIIMFGRCKDCVKPA